MGDLTRYTTDQERANIVGVTVNEQDLSHVMDLVQKGIVSAAQRHESAVQDDMALSYEVAISLRRPVKTDDGAIDILTGEEKITGRLTASKNYANPDLKPVVE